MTHSEVSAADRARLIAAGLAEDFVAPVAALERFVEDWPFELDDPLTLSRFLLGKPENLMEAKDRVTQARDWRAKTDLRRIMHEWGVQKDMVWNWEPQTERAKALAPHFFGRCVAARTASGGPVIVLRLGEFDLEGAVREDMVDDLMDPWIFLIEQAFQDCRSVSLSKRSLVKLSAIVDVDGVSLSWLQHMSVLEQFSRAINRNYPEMAATLTIVRAPVIFSWLWQVSAPLLLEDMTRRKFAILGHDFQAGLVEHARVDFRELPECLRGRSDTANSQEAPAPVRFRPGARVALPTRPWPPRPAACLIESNSRSSSQREERGQLAFVELPVFGTDGSAISADLRHAFSGCFRAARVCRVDPTCRRREMQRATWKCLFVRFARDTLIHVLHLAACDCGLLHMSSPFRRRHYRGPSKRVFMRSVADFRLIRVPPAHCSSCVDNRHYVSAPVLDQPAADSGRGCHSRT